METKELEKPKYSKIADVRPGLHCFFLYGKVLKATQSEIARISGDKVKVVEGVVADDSGSVAFHFEGPYADLVKQGETISIRNGRSEVVDEHIRLEVDKFGKVAKEDASVVKTVNEKNDLSAVAYEKQQPRGKGRDDNEGRRDGYAGGRREGNDRRDGHDGRRGGYEGRREGYEGRREGQDSKRDGQDQKKEQSDRK